MPTALVTGANGHVGAHLCRELLAHGYPVVAMVRRSADLRGLAGLDVELRRGDVLDEESFAAAAEGAEILFHTAAVYETWTLDPESIMRPALEGTKNAIAAAKRHGVRRIVYTSSVVAIGTSRDPERLRTAADWNEDPTNVYYVAKTESERRAHELAAEAGIELVTVNPASVYGALDFRITPSTRLVQMLLNGKGFTFRGGLNLVAASDVAVAHRLVAEKGEPGRRYIAGGDNVEVRDIGRLLRELAGVRILHAPFPRWMQYVVAFFMEIGARITGRPPLGTRSIVKENVDRYMFYDFAETRALGYEPRSAADVLSETIAWLLHLGGLKPRLAARLRSAFPPRPEWQALLAAPEERGERSQA